MTLGGKKVNRRDQTSFGVIDYVLMSIGSCLAAFSAGMAIGVPECGQVFVAFIVLGTIASLTIRKFFSTSRFLQLDALFYTLASAGAVAFTGALNQFLPGDGIPQDVTTAGWLCWMLTFGSFLAWRDRTLLFQAVPTIALFGLIGCYDTYPPAPFLFFGFLLCLATLLGRSHSREMLRLAVLSGYFNRGESKHQITEHPEQSPELYETIKKGPWRWLAGPEWALGSGLVIVIFSLLGAPVIRQAVQPISGAVRVFTPRRMSQASTSHTPDSSNSYVVGRGPLTGQKMPPVPQYVVKFDKIRYLRTAVYDSYNGRGWFSGLLGRQSAEDAGLGAAAVDKMKDLRRIHLTIDMLTPSNVIPLPAEVIGSNPGIQFRADGSGVSQNEFVHEFEIFGYDSGAKPVTAEHSVPGASAFTDADKTSVVPSVQQFAKDAAKGGSTDFEKATLVMNAISSRCKYYKSASAVPEGKDAADYFLNTSQRGYCDLFATAMVESARAIDIPAHFCIGFLADGKNTDSKGETTIFDKDYHAWAELYFKDVGWVVFDATTGAQEIDEDAPQTGNNWLANSLSTILDVFIGLTVVVILVGVVFTAIRSRKKNPAKFLTETRRVYARFAKDLYGFTHLRRELTETADEYMARLGPYLGDAAESTSLLNEKLVSALYGVDELGSEAVAGLWSDLKAFESALKRVPRPPEPQS